LAETLHLDGRLVYHGDDDMLSGFVVLNPEWLTQAISFVLEDAPTGAAGGILDHARLRRIWGRRNGWPGYPAHHHPYFLRLMEKYDMSYRLAEDRRDAAAARRPRAEHGLPAERSGSGADRVADGAPPRRRDRQAVAQRRLPAPPGPGVRVGGADRAALAGRALDRGARALAGLLLQCAALQHGRRHHPALARRGVRAAGP